MTHKGLPCTNALRLIPAQAGTQKIQAMFSGLLLSQEQAWTAAFPAVPTKGPPAPWVSRRRGI